MLDGQRKPEYKSCIKRI